MKSVTYPKYLSAYVKAFLSHVADGYKMKCI